MFDFLHSKKFNTLENKINSLELQIKLNSEKNNKNISIVETSLVNEVKELSNRVRRLESLFDELNTAKKYDENIGSLKENDELQTKAKASKKKTTKTTKKAKAVKEEVNE